MWHDYSARIAFQLMELWQTNFSPILLTFVVALDILAVLLTLPAAKDHRM